MDIVVRVGVVVKMIGDQLEIAYFSETCSGLSATAIGLEQITLSPAPAQHVISIKNIVLFDAIYGIC